MNGEHCLHGQMVPVRVGVSLNLNRCKLRRYNAARAVLNRVILILERSCQKNFGKIKKTAPPGCLVRDRVYSSWVNIQAAPTPWPLIDPTRALLTRFDVYGPSVAPSLTVNLDQVPCHRLAVLRADLYAQTVLCRYAEAPHIDSKADIPVTWRVPIRDQVGDHVHISVRCRQRG
ncbi:hypothetical protein Bpro_5374 (plasmid) [Polaromonas sp. JS666]|nr:hypothetical protein Bpro_5374 [Polaromonas sp. JS666]